MFSSIQKVWSEISEENQVKFSPSAVKATKKTQHYIREDRPLNPVLNRTQKSSGYKGSPRILKPRSDNTKSGTSVIWGTLGKIGKAMVRDDSELDIMKNYMNGMIRTKSIKKTTSKRTTTSSRDLKRSRASRSGLLSSRIERLTKPDIYKMSKSFEPRISPPPLSRNNTSSSKKKIDLIDDPQRIFIPSSKLQMEIPSSPEGVMDLTQLKAISPENNSDDKKIQDLSDKLHQLENTVESLREELRSWSERSSKEEQSFKYNDETILRPEEFDKIKMYDPENDKEIGKNQNIMDIEIPLSPVKLDLSKFKIIR